MEIIKKQKATLDEWKKRGKEAYKSNANMFRSNSHHQDYDSKEKVELAHDKAEKLEDIYLFSDRKIKLLRDKWNYSDEEIENAKSAWLSGYRSSRAWYKKADKKYQAIIDSYKSIFDEASKIAYKVDVSDIKDGFPCGWAIISLDISMHDSPLGKATAHFNGGARTPMYKYRLKIDTPSHGQCISYDEKINKEVVDYLRLQKVFANSYSIID